LEAFSGKQAACRDIDAVHLKFPTDRTILPNEFRRHRLNSSIHRTCPRTKRSISRKAFTLGSEVQTPNEPGVCFLR